MHKNIFLLFISVALVFASCSKARFEGAGKYKVNVKVEGDSAYIDNMQVQYWDSEYNNHKIDVKFPDKATEFTTPEYQVGKAIVVNVKANNSNGSFSGSNSHKKPVYLVVELLKNGKVVRRGEDKRLGYAEVELKTPLEKK